MELATSRSGQTEGWQLVRFFHRWMKYSNTCPVCAKCEDGFHFSRDSISSKSIRRNTW